MRTKIKSLLASLLAVAMVLSLLPAAAFAGDGEDGFLSLNSSDDVEYSVTMTTSYSYYNEEEDYTYYYVFDTDDLILSVEQSGDSDDLPDGYTVEYFLCEEENYNYVTLTDNGDNTATLSVDLSEDLADEGYTNGYSVGVYAVVSYEGNEIVSYHDLWIEVLVAYDYYYTFGDCTILLGGILLGDDAGVSNTFEREYRNMDNVYGAYDEIAVSDMEVTASYVWDDDAGEYVETEDTIIWLGGSYDDGGWYFGTGSYFGTANIGYATVTARYTDADGGEQSFEFNVYVVSSLSLIDNYGWTDGVDTDNILVGAQRELSMAYVFRSLIWDDDENDWVEGTSNVINYSLAELPDGYSVSLVPENENISAEVTEDGAILVTANSAGGAWLYVYVLDGDGSVVAESSQWVGTCDSYYMITGDLGDVLPGDTLDLSAADFILTCYYIDENGSANTKEVELDGESYYARLNTDSVDWDAWAYADGSSEEDALPALVRIGNGWTSMQIEVYDSDGNWLCDCWPYVEYVRYSVNMTASYYYEEDSYYYVFDTDDLILSVEQSEDSNDLPDGYTVEYYLTDKESSNYVTLTDNGDNTATLSVDLSEDLVNEGYTSGYFFGVNARVSYEGNRFTSCVLNDLEVLVAEENYHTFGDYTMVLGEGEWFDNLGYYVRDMNHVWGEDGEADITDVQVTESYPDDGESEVVSLDGSSDEGWNINPISTGSAVVTAWYSDLDGEEQSFTFIVNVVGERYWVDVWYGDDLNTDQLLVGASREAAMNFAVRATCWDDDGYYRVEDSCYSLSEMESLGYSMTWDYDGDGRISVERDGDSLVVTGDAEGYVTLHLYAQDEDGNTVAGSDIGFNVTTSPYYTITGSLGDVPVGDTLDLSAVDYTLTYYYIDEDGNPCTEEVELDGENYYARLNTDNIDWNAWIYADGSSEEDALPALVRIGNWWTSMQIEVYDSDGNWLCDYWPYVEEIGYGAYIEESYDGENYIFEMIEWPGNDYDFPEGYTVGWNVYVDTEDGWQDASDYGVTYSVEDNILTITEWGHTDIIIQSYACYQSENNFCWVGEYYCTLHTFELNRTKEATCTEEGYNYYVCTECGDSWTETIPAGHSYAGMTETIEEATCTEDGAVRITVACTVCGDVVYTNTVTMPATGHTWDDGTVTTEATCTEVGVKTYTCSVCGETYTESIPAAGHSYEETVIAPTCTEGGKTEHKCSVCGNIYYTELTSATGHTYVEDTAKRVEPTCTEDGSATYTCSICGDSYTETLSATGHSWDAGVVTKTATATEEGEITYTCTVCGETYTEVVEAIATVGDTVVLRSGNTFSFWYTLESDGPDLVLDYGLAGDEVLIGDWDGDGIDTICVRRGNTFYFKNDFSSGDADFFITYGKEGDEVLVGDWNSDGMDTLAVRRDGNRYYFKYSIDGGAADEVITYGRSMDVMLVGDWNGDGKDTLCARRENVYYFKNAIESGDADLMYVYGDTTDESYAGRWR
ncbi:MAG: hypothetical protein LUF32_07600 [Clostridiales bacterium]|nr:hypothetical protein [Clostridiales bacterium]